MCFIVNPEVQTVYSSLAGTSTTLGCPSDDLRKVLLAHGDEPFAGVSAGGEEVTDYGVKPPNVTQALL